MNIKDLIDMSANMTNTTVNVAITDEIELIGRLSCEILSHIDGFIEEYGDEWITYPEEYFENNKKATQGAINSFINILCELEEYIND